MKENNLYKIWIVVFIIVLLLSGLVTAEERDIYIGDLFTLKVTSDSYTLEDLQKKFSDFEIVDSKKIAGSDELDTGYELTVRTFESGEYSILLGDKKIEIVVSSTLENNERDSIFSGELSPLKSSYSSIWFYLFYGLIIVLAIIFIILIWQYIKNKQKEDENSYQRFISKMAVIEITKDDYFVELTFIFKEYLENTFGYQIRGKTSGEIIDEIKDIPELEEKLSEIQTWLRLADYYKYTEAVATADIKEKQQLKLKDLAADIEGIIQVNEG